MPRRPDSSIVLVDGPWNHRTVRANGIAMHVAELGSGPLVLLLHGFPEFWWAWRRQLVDLADAGFRAVAVDLRGFGATDKPPRGYDAPNLAADLAALVTSLGEQDAMVVGNDLGGLLAWAMAANHREVVRSMVLLGAAHPLRLRAAIARDPEQRRASAYALRTFQLPRRPEALLTRDARWVRHLFDTWTGPRWRGTPGYRADVERYAEAMRIPQVAFDRIMIQFKVNKAIRNVNGWAFDSQTGVYGTDYLNRALITAIGLGANRIQDACYPTSHKDNDGKDYVGSNKYVMRFPAGELPPVNGFWSLTMYDADYFFVQNPINRYSVSPRDSLKTNPDGSVDLLIQNESPGAMRETNWLPAPKGPFILMLRNYWPKDALLNGSWAPPPVTRSAGATL